ncbi:Uncharacterized protein BWINRA5_00010 [Bacillus mycoides]|uniref:hypothetical protein n=1 Tax=Bacillus mycoides TaxID=1405 RepID=UPI0008185FC8|nr:hypothetical protein [Bacillus mycoides]SCA96695.1 Uncharacterized protein BWINRA5_00010 [Bacillus mycoides]
MKLTLFTISNEQIKEQLSKLQTKVESLENMKELQDKVISMQDHQISFLNDSIANMWQPIAIVAGIAALVITGAFAYVSILHHQAKRKREEVERLIQDSHSIATVAQEKLNELEEKQLLLQKQTKAIENIQKFEMITAQIQRDLGFIQRRFNKDRSYCVGEQKNEFNELCHENSNLEIKDKISKKINILEDDIQNVEKLQNDVDKFTERYLKFYGKLRSQNSEE